MGEANRDVDALLAEVRRLREAGERVRQAWKAHEAVGETLARLSAASPAWALEDAAESARAALDALRAAVEGLRP